jgi:hypothetical protein
MRRTLLVAGLVVALLVLAALAPLLSHDTPTTKRRTPR